MANMINNNWTLVTSHGLVLFHLAVHPDSTMRQTASSVDLTERRVNRIIRDLVEAGLVDSQREGRRNTYRINKRACFRHSTLATVPLSTILDALPVKDAGNWRGDEPLAKHRDVLSV